jgi:hypothetical protein
MIRGDVEHLEVGQVVLDLGPFVDDEAELAEDLRDRLDRLGNGMQRAPGDRPARQGHVDLSRPRARCACDRRSEPRSASAPLTASPTSLATAPTRGRSSAGSAPMPRRTAVRSPFLPRYWICSASSAAGSAAGRDLLQRPRLQASQVGAQAFEVHAAVPHSRRGRPRRHSENLEPSTPRSPGDESSRYHSPGESRGLDRIRPSRDDRLSRVPSLRTGDASRAQSVSAPGRPSAVLGR